MCRYCTSRRFTPIHPSPLSTGRGEDDQGFDEEDDGEYCCVSGGDEGTSDIMNIIEQCSLFKSAPKTFFLDLLSGLQPMVFHPQEQIVSKGDISSCVYWLIKGTAAMNSEPKMLHAELAPGSYFGESSLLVQSPRSTTIIAQTKCLIMSINANTLMGVLANYPSLRTEVLQRIKKKATSLELMILQRQKKRPYTVFKQDDINCNDVNDSILLKKTCLEKIPMFHSTLPSYELHALAASVDIQSYFQYEYVFRQDCQSKDVYFVTEGVVEVVDQRPNRVKALLSKGSMFGEVTFLGMSSSRTASIRTATPAQLLVVSHTVLSDLCRKYPSVLSQIEEVASYHIMHNRVSHNESQNETHPSELEKNDNDFDFDMSPPSLPPNHSINTDISSSAVSFNVPSDVLQPASKSPSSSSSSSSSSFHKPPKKRQRTLRYKRRTSLFNVGPFPDVIQMRIFQYLQLPTLMRLQRVCTHWYQILTKNTSILGELDLTPFNTTINDSSIIPITNFAGNRPHYVDISNCFHLTDQGFSYLVNGIGMAEVNAFKMKSTWDVSSNAILELTTTPVSSTLTQIDLTNCRKVNDATIIRLIGWTVNQDGESKTVGCPNLHTLTLSYCKHITDRAMYYISEYASDRLVSLDLSRCTGITDNGFSYWAMKQFQNLRYLNLTDCTFLTDKAIIALAGSAKSLEELNLSFCCALTDVSIQVLSLGCPNLKTLNLSYCGPAVNDRSLTMIGHHLTNLRNLSIRGCLLVTRVGVDSILRDCPHIESLNISQCKNVK
ncbi:hypothetical protein TRICI_002806 [Trichomonascus ciferrii]|uniref:Cyclic nucleotide-binding domain-containing protein n=1 Tax=Trichomonascus ciferrii TaxID=44093 RepID=A0A642VAS9_9ASCO|nr:hypothetical protein TRICI_002806 [Trichomonascus ciferrii]